MNSAVLGNHPLIALLVQLVLTFGHVKRFIVRDQCDLLLRLVGLLRREPRL